MNMESSECVQQQDQQAPPSSSSSLSNGSNPVSTNANVYTTPAITNEEIENMWSRWIDPNFERQLLMQKYPTIIPHLRYPLGIAMAKPLYTSQTNAYPEIFQQRGVQATAVTVLGGASNMVEVKQNVDALMSRNVNICNAFGTIIGSNWMLVCPPPEELIKQSHFREAYVKRQELILRAYAGVLNDTRTAYLARVKQSIDDQNRMNKIGVNYHECASTFEQNVALLEIKQQCVNPVSILETRKLKKKRGHDAADSNDSSNATGISNKKIDHTRLTPQHYSLSSSSQQRIDEGNDGDNEDEDEELTEDEKRAYWRLNLPVTLLPNTPSYSIVAYVPDLTGLPPLYPGQVGMMKISGLTDNINVISEIFEAMRDLYNNRISHYAILNGCAYRFPMVPGRVSVENMHFANTSDQQEIKQQLHGSREIQKEMMRGNNSCIGIQENIDTGAIETSENTNTGEEFSAMQS